MAHPHICYLYDVGSQSGTDYLVMELLEGETLATRLKKGPLTASEVLRIGTEIADALASAHRLGLVHRDLKPSNVMLTKTGAKLMDFGLAKPAVAGPAVAPPEAVLSGDTLTAMQQSPGISITIAGSIVGTIQYMSPEQLEGKEADARSDIFALGEVLYEMATGKRAFEGKTHLSVVSAILHQEPKPVSALQPTSPAGLNYIIATCLAKDPDERFQTAHDMKLQLNWVAQGASSSAASTPVEERIAPTKRGWLIGSGVVGAGALVLLGFAMSRFSGGTTGAGAAAGPTRLTVTLPPKQELGADITMAEAISPDGKRLAYIGVESGLPRLYTRRLDEFEAVAIPASDGAIFPFFSPKGDWIAFFSQGN